MGLRREWELTKTAYYKMKIAKFKYKLVVAERKLYWNRRKQQ